jgi:hypothetical protein
MAEFSLEQALRLYSSDVIDKVTRFSAPKPTAVGAGA